MPTAFGVTFAEGHKDRARTIALEVQAHLNRDWNVGDHAREISSVLSAGRFEARVHDSWPPPPFRPSVLATNDPNRLGLPFCQPSGVRSCEDLTGPFRIPCPSTCGNHGRGGRCGQRLPLRLSMRRIRPTGGRASIRSIPLMSALVAEGAVVDPWRFVPMAAMPPSCPSRACSRKLRRARAMLRPGARIWSTSSAS